MEGHVVPASGRMLGSGRVLAPLLEATRFVLCGFGQGESGCWGGFSLGHVRTSVGMASEAQGDLDHSTQLGRGAEASWR